MAKNISHICFEFEKSKSLTICFEFYVLSSSPAFQHATRVFFISLLGLLFGFFRVSVISSLGPFFGCFRVSVISSLEPFFGCHEILSSRGGVQTLCLE